MSFLEDATKETWTSALKLIATYSCGILAGSSFYIPCVEHPNRMIMAPDTAMRNWRGCFHLAKRQGQIVGTISMLASAGAFALNYNTDKEEHLWLTTTVILFSVTPYTILCIKPTNDILLETEAVIREKDDKWIKEKLSNWCCLHNVRVGMAFAALGLMTYSLVYK